MDAASNGLGGTVTFRVSVEGGTATSSSGFSSPVAMQDTLIGLQPPSETMQETSHRHVRHPDGTHGFVGLRSNPMLSVTTVTVGAVDAGGYGFVAGAAGGLSDTAFDIGTTQHTVDAVVEGSDGAGALRLSLGVTFKENVRDCRNTRVGALVRELEPFGVELSVHDPLVSSDQIIQLGLRSVDDPFAAPHRYDGVVLAVAHRQFRCIEPLRYAALCGRDGRRGVLVDLKGILPRHQVEREGTLYWRP